MKRCKITRCQEVGRGFLDDETMTYTWEVGTCNTPLFRGDELAAGICRSCLKLGCEPDKVYEGNNTDEGWTMTELTDDEIAERLARPAAVRSTRK